MIEQQTCIPSMRIYEFPTNKETLKMALGTHSNIKPENEIEGYEDSLDIGFPVKFQLKSIMIQIIKGMLPSFHCSK